MEKPCITLNTPALPENVTGAERLVQMEQYYRNTYQALLDKKILTADMLLSNTAGSRLLWLKPMDNIQAVILREKLQKEGVGTLSETAVEQIAPEEDDYDN
jgi:hypothetical protein